MIFDLYDEDDVRLIQQAFAEKTVGITSGTWDLFHPSHEAYLSGCRRHCGHDGALIVGVDSDHLVRIRKGPNRPVVPEPDRLQSVAGRKGVAAAFILGTVEDFGRAAELFRVRYIFKNQDFGNEKILGTDLPGVELVIVPDFHRAESTTELIAKILASQTKLPIS